MHVKFFKCEGCGNPKPAALRVPSSPKFCWRCFLDGLKKVVLKRKTQNNGKIRPKKPNFTEFKPGDIISMNGVGPYTVTGVDGYQVEYNTGIGPGWADAKVMNLKKYEIKRQPILL